MEPVQVLTWVVIAVFALTALITLGGIVESLKIIQVKEEYLHKLFPVLLLEIVAICIPIAGEELRCDDECMLEKIENLDPFSKLGSEILAMRDNSEGIFKTTEYKMEITFGEFDSTREAKVCPEAPLYFKHVLLFNKGRNEVTHVIAFTPAPHLCTESNVYKIEISRAWAAEVFGVTDTTISKIDGWGIVTPPIPINPI